MSIITRDDLERLGLDMPPEAFERLLRDAVRSLPASTAAGNAGHDLTVAEVATLERGGFDLASEAAEELIDDPLARGAAEYAALLASALTPAQVAERLGIDVSRVRHRLAARTLYGLKTPEGWRLPLFQFDPATGGGLAGIGVVLAALMPDLHPVSVQRWFLTPDPDLAIAGRVVSPRDWLRHGGSPSAVTPLSHVV